MSAKHKNKARPSTPAAPTAAPTEQAVPPATELAAAQVEPATPQVEPPVEAGAALNDAEQSDGHDEGDEAPKRLGAPPAARDAEGRIIMDPDVPGKRLRADDPRAEALGAVPQASRGPSAPRKRPPAPSREAVARASAPPKPEVIPVAVARAMALREAKLRVAVGASKIEPLILGPAHKGQLKLLSALGGPDLSAIPVTAMQLVVVARDEAGTPLDAQPSQVETNVEAALTHAVAELGAWLLPQIPDLPWVPAAFTAVACAGAILTAWGNAPPASDIKVRDVGTGSAK